MALAGALARPGSASPLLHLPGEAAGHSPRAAPSRPHLRRALPSGSPSRSTPSPPPGPRERAFGSSPESPPRPAARGLRGPKARSQVWRPQESGGGEFAEEGGAWRPPPAVVYAPGTVTSRVGDFEWQAPPSSLSQSPLPRRVAGGAKLWAIWWGSAIGQTSLSPAETCGVQRAGPAAAGPCRL